MLCAGQVRVLCSLVWVGRGWRGVLLLRGWGRILDEFDAGFDIALQSTGSLGALNGYFDQRLLGRGGVLEGVQGFFDAGRLQW